MGHVGHGPTVWWVTWVMGHERWPISISGPACMEPRKIWIWTILGPQNSCQNGQLWIWEATSESVGSAPCPNVELPLIGRLVVCKHRPSNTKAIFLSLLVRVVCLSVSLSGCLSEFSKYFFSGSSCQNELIFLHDSPLPGENNSSSRISDWDFTTSVITSWNFAWDPVRTTQW